MNVLKTRGALYTLCILRGGYRNGITLIRFVEDWQECVTVHERTVGTEEYVRWTRSYGRRRVYQLLDLFRRTFPQLGPQGTPEGLMGPLLDRLAKEAAAEVESPPA
jgi:hypothetical protein